MKKTKKQTRGITLIALVITIVVLIILATISINVVFSENGIIKKAELAKSMHANSEVAEEESMNTLLGEYANMMEANSIPDESTNSTDTDTPTEPEVPTGPNGKQLVSSVTATDHETIIGEDDKGNQVVIPGGFKIAEDSGSTVQQGIVIEDSDENQFVWIPVSNINNDGSNKIVLDDGSTVEITLGRYRFATSSPGTATLVQSGLLWAETESSVNTTYKIVNSSSSSYYHYELATTTSTTPTKDLESFINSVSENKGYYLARYEASYASGSEFEVGESETYYKPASKISTTNSTSSMSYTEGTLWSSISQGNASTACRQMYYGDSYVESDLCNSYAWDTAIVYIQAMGNSNYANQTDGNGTLKNTGETGDEKCKIFDMAANFSEWTTERCTNSDNPCTYRGGNYRVSYSYTAYRYRGTTDPYAVGFRPILYGKTEAE